MNDQPDETNQSSKPPSLKAFLGSVFYGNFEMALTLTTLLGVLLIFFASGHMLSSLGLFFLPVILSGYFLNTRSSVLSGIASFLIVGSWYLFKPALFAGENPTGGPYTLLLWGCSLILCSALIGIMNEQVRGRFRKASEIVNKINEVQEELGNRQRELENTNRTLEETKSRLESILHYTMDPAVAQLIIQHKLENEKREITVLFADLENFTASVEGIPPEFIIHNLNRLFSDLEPILSRFRGHLDKYIGDGFMAEFGVPYLARQHALLAVTAAVRIQDYLKKNSPWKMRIGIANGPSVVGLVGSNNRKNYTAIGDIVNLADRLQRLCPAGSVCVDRSTHNQISRWFRTRPLKRPLNKEDQELFERAQSKLDPEGREAIEEAMVKAFLKEEEAGYVAIKGKEQPVAIYEVLGFADPLENYWRVPQEAKGLYRKLRQEMSFPFPEESLLALEAMGGSIGHSRVSAALAVAIAERMGLDIRAQKDVLIAAILHDIGKLDFPEHLLSHQRPFSDLPQSDQERLQNHGAAAEKILNALNIPVSPAVLTTIRQHHEHYDGSGFPERLKGEQIGLLARILQLADEYEALTAWRPYRDKREIPAALAALKHEVVEGKFDPRIGEIFIKMLDSTLGII